MTDEPRAGVAFVTDADDPRLDDYRDIKEHELRARGGRFIAESEGVVRVLLRSGITVRSVLLTAPRLAALEDALPPTCPVFVVPQAIMDAVAGLHVHRGCLASAERPAHVAVPPHARTILVLEDLVDVDNVGSLARNAAAFGADAIVLSPRCADPYYRKAIRTSMGTVFSLPIVRHAEWPADLLALRASHGLTLVGAVLDDDATPLRAFAAARPPRVALLLGSEGPGLRPETKALCDARVTVPMSAADSLNVATAGAIFLYELAGRERGQPVMPSLRR